MELYINQIISIRAIGGIVIVKFMDEVEMLLKCKSLDFDDNTVYCNGYIKHWPSGGELK